MKKPISKGTSLRTQKEFVGRQGTIPRGLIGSVVFNDGDCLGVRFNTAVPALEEWGNIGHFYGDTSPTKNPEDEVISLCEAA